MTRQWLLRLTTAGMLLLGSNAYGTCPENPTTTNWANEAVCQEHMGFSDQKQGKTLTTKQVDAWAEAAGKDPNERPR